jgi:dihydrofolate reductase
MTNVKLIYAASLNGVIGNKGKIPWHIPEDLQAFKEKTRGDVVVMGRKTWESLPDSVRPLPGRINVVLSTSVGATSFPGAIMTNSFRNAVSLARERNLWVIGGEKLLIEAMPLATEIHFTEVMLSVKGDTCAPVVDARVFELIDMSRIRQDEQTNICYRNRIYKRITAVKKR